MSEKLKMVHHARESINLTRPFEPRLPADPHDPFRVQRSHLEKMEVGKSSSSCKLSLVIRPHRTAALQEFWCASFEEAAVYVSLAAHPEVISFREQMTRVDYLDANDDPKHTRVDAHVLLADGQELLVSVKYDEKARRASYRADVARIAAQCPRDVADRFTVLSRYSFHPNWRDSANKIHYARRGWDPEADAVVLEAANSLPSSFELRELVQASALSGRGWRAAVRLIGDGDIKKHPLDLIDASTLCRRAAAA